MRILARLQEMSAGEITAYIPASEYIRIKNKDPEPQFRAYVIGHEGISSGRVIGEGPLVKRWFASAIQKLHDKLQLGLKVFHNHAATNEHAGRPSIGEVVGKALKSIGDKLMTIAITYIKPEYRGLPLDVASIEADVRLTESGGIYDADIGDITGIALGSSAVVTPGFAQATLLAQVQAFADKSPTRFQRGGVVKSIDEIKALVNEQGLLPSDIFERKALSDDPIVAGIVKAETHGMAEDRHNRLEAHRQAAEQAKKDADTKIAAAQKDFDDKQKSLLRELAKSKVPGLFSKAKTERKLDEKQAKFIEDRLAKFDPSAPEVLEKEFGAHLDSELTEYDKVAEIFGQKKTAGQAGDDKDKKGGGEQTPPTPGGTPESKYLDPAQNPLIMR